jgi:hypothetical protein
MSLAAEEFIRRFLLHVLPDRFMRIRHYGFVSNCQRADKLALCRALLGPTQEAESGEPLGLTTAGELVGHRFDDLCPSCKLGRLRVVETLGPLREASLPSDTS